MDAGRLVEELASRVTFSHPPISPPRPATFSPTASRSSLSPPLATLRCSSCTTALTAARYALGLAALVLLFPLPPSFSWLTRASSPSHPPRSDCAQRVCAQPREDCGARRAAGRGFDQRQGPPPLGGRRVIWNAGQGAVRGLMCGRAGVLAWLCPSRPVDASSPVVSFLLLVEKLNLA